VTPRFRDSCARSRATTVARLWRQSPHVLRPLITSNYGRCVIISRRCYFLSRADRSSEIESRRERDSLEKGIPRAKKALRRERERERERRVNNSHSDESIVPRRGARDRSNYGELRRGFQSAPRLPREFFSNLSPRSLRTLVHPLFSFSSSSFHRCARSPLSVSEPFSSARLLISTRIPPLPLLPLPLFTRRILITIVIMALKKFRLPI